MLSDFGLSKIIEPEGQQSGYPATGSGCSPYAAPEIRPGEIVGLEADIWSVGCILLDALSFNFDGYDGYLKLLNSRRCMLENSRGRGQDTRFYDQNTNCLKPKVEAWIRGIKAEHQHDNIIRRYLELVQMMTSAVSLRKQYDMRYFESEFSNLFDTSRAAPPQLSNGKGLVHTPNLLTAHVDHPSIHHESPAPGIRSYQFPASDYLTDSFGIMHSPSQSSLTSDSPLSSHYEYNNFPRRYHSADWTSHFSHQTASEMRVNLMSNSSVMSPTAPLISSVNGVQVHQMHSRPPYPKLHIGDLKPSCPDAGQAELDFKRLAQVDTVYHYSPHIVFKTNLTA